MPYIFYKNKQTAKEEKVAILSSKVMDLIVKKESNNPWCYYPEYDFWIPLSKGYKGPHDFSFTFGHAVAVLLTNKRIDNQNLCFLVDLSCAQYDIFSRTEKGYPLYIKPFLSSDRENEEFILSKTLDDLHSSGLPLDNLNAIENKTLANVMKLLNIK